MKERLEIRIDKELRAGLDLEVLQTGRPLTGIVEEFIKEGLARRQGKLIEVESLPEIRVVVREETAKVMAELYDKYEAALVKMARRSDDRLAALIVKAARYSGIAQRMLYALLSKMVSPDFAGRAYEDAKGKTGKDIARSDEMI